MSKIINELKKKNLLSWEVVYYGLKKSFCTMDDVSSFTYSELDSNIPNDADFAIELLTDLPNLTENELVSRLEGYVSKIDYFEERVKNVWKFAFLKELSDREISEEDKIKELQEVYARLDYPEDMSSCNIYSVSEVDPLVAMDEIINAFERNLES